jgi:hypothetical protein
MKRFGGRAGFERALPVILGTSIAEMLMGYVSSKKENTFQFGKWHFFATLISFKNLKVNHI